MLQVDEVVVGMGVDRGSVGRSGIASSRIGGRNRSRRDAGRAAEGHIVENWQMLGDCTVGSRIEFPDLGHAPPAVSVG